MFGDLLRTKIGIGVTKTDTNVENFVVEKIEWEKLREPFIILCGTLQKVADYMAPVVLLCYVQNIYEVVVDVFQILSGNLISENSLSLFVSLFQLTLRIALITYHVSEMQHSFMKISEILSECPGYLYEISVACIKFAGMMETATVDKMHRNFIAGTLCLGRVIGVIPHSGVIKWYITGNLKHRGLFLVDYVPYNPVSSLAFILFDKAGVLAWNFGPIFVIVICRLCTRQLHMFGDLLRIKIGIEAAKTDAKVENFVVEKIEWEKLRESFIILCGTLQKVADYMAPVVLLCYVQNIYEVIFDVCY
ncbi:unnamed protein product [Orchesella dallaii]